jgi:hypothetical protein
VRVLAAMLACALVHAGEELPSLSTLVINGEVLHANTLEVASLAFRDVTARPRYLYNPTTTVATLGFLDIQAKAYRGLVSGWYAIELTGERRAHTCRFDVTGGDLATLLRSLGSTNDQLAGQIDGWFEMRLPVADGPASGRGQLEISKGSLVQLPLLVNFLAGNPAAARGKDALTARFQLRETGIELLWLRLDSPAIQLAARGRIGYDGKLEIEITPRLAFGIISKVPLFGGWAASGLSRLTSRVTRAYVRGHISQPVIVIDAFGR